MMKISPNFLDIKRALNILLPRADSRIPEIAWSRDGGRGSPL